MEDITDLPAERATYTFKGWCNRNNGKFTNSDHSHPTCWIGGSASVHLDPLYGSIAMQSEFDPEVEHGADMVTSADRFRNPDSIVIDGRDLHIKYGSTPIKSIGKDIDLRF